MKGFPVRIRRRALGFCRLRAREVNSPVNIGVRFFPEGLVHELGIEPIGMDVGPERQHASVSVYEMGGDLSERLSIPGEPSGRPDRA
jgi:hypothetical protein